MRLFPCMVALCAFGLDAICVAPAAAQSANVRITGLSDVGFGTVSTAADTVMSQNVCAFSSTATKGYRVTASGSGTAGAFTLANGSKTLAYQVQWNSLSGQTSGTNLTANVALSGQTSSATQQSCNSGPTSSGTLLVIVRSSAAGSATAGTYSGTLTLLLGAE